MDEATREETPVIGQAPSFAPSPETVSMQTRDGVRLDSDIYWPNPDRHGEGPFPVLLMRQPYGRRTAATMVYAHPTWYADQGYIVVIQDIRGCGTSTGNWRLFESEIADGADTIAWATTLPGSSGTVGMYGFSHQGMTQLYAAIGASDHRKPAPLRAIAPAMVGWSLYDDWAYEGGAFRLEGTLTWALQMACLQARHDGDDEAFAALYEAAHNLPIKEPATCLPPIVEAHPQCDFYLDWVDNDRPGPYWDGLAPRALADRLPDIPMLHVGGWFDPKLRGTLAAYHHLRARHSAPQELLIGPWPQFPWGRRAGPIDFGPDAVSNIDTVQIAWFDRFLKDTDSDDIPPMRLFEMGSNQWRDFEDWPQTAEGVWHLHGTGLSAASTDAGILQPDRPNQVGSDSFVQDPWRPAPALGGHWASPYGPQDRAALDDRGDVAVYTGPPLEHDLHLAGSPYVELWAGSDMPSYDLACSLSVVTEDGRSRVLSNGMRRVEGVAEPVRVDLQCVCARIQAGHRMRLSIAGAAFPAFPVNPGTGARAKDTRLIDQRITTITISSGGHTPSRVVLPEAG